VRETVNHVERTFEAMEQRGELRELNVAFKAARAIDPTLRCWDFMKAKKTAILEAVATGR
jgi:hypothetical protein